MPQLLESGLIPIKKSNAKSPVLESLYNNLRVYCSTKTAQRINLLKELFFALIFSHYLRDVRSDEYHLLNCSVVAATLHKTLYLSRGLKSAFNVWEGDHKRRMPAGT